MNLLEMTTEQIIGEIENNFVDLYIPAEVISKYNISLLMNLIEGHARKIEPHIYEDDRIANDNEYIDEDIEDAYKNLSIPALSKTFIESLDYDDDIKNRLQASIKELYNSIVAKES